MTCEEKRDKVDENGETKQINPFILQAQMYTAFAIRETERSLPAALEQRIKTVHDLMKYLSFVPIGKSTLVQKRIDPELRKKIFHERGCICELCQAKLDYKNFRMHHTNYFKKNDPDYLKVVCKPCHSIINMLTEVVSWFEDKTKPNCKESPTYQGDISIPVQLPTSPAYTRLFRLHTDSSDPGSE